jgi:hypothetical protein
MEVEENIKASVTKMHIPVVLPFHLKIKSRYPPCYTLTRMALQPHGHVTTHAASYLQCFQEFVFFPLGIDQ